MIPVYHQVQEKIRVCWHKHGQGDYLAYQDYTLKPIPVSGNL